MYVVLGYGALFASIYNRIENGNIEVLENEHNNKSGWGKR